MDLAEGLNVVRLAIDDLYRRDFALFERNEKRGVCERCLMFRFSHYLQIRFCECCGDHYVVDCDFNASDSEMGKPIPMNTDVRLRYVDVVVHRRGISENNFLCIEAKKWNNYDRNGIRKDENNLSELVSTNGRYKYKCGIYLVFGKNKNESKWKVFCGDQSYTQLGLHNIF